MMGSEKGFEVELENEASVIEDVVEHDQLLASENYLPLEKKIHSRGCAHSHHTAIQI